MALLDPQELIADRLLRQARAATDPVYPAHPEPTFYRRIRRHEMLCGLDVGRVEFVAHYRPVDLTLISRRAGLTGRQREILNYRRMGYSYRDIARQCCVSYKTVYRDMRDMIPKLCANRCDDLVELLCSVFGRSAVYDALGL
jgi:DNA-binding CsgD family transcriptional regulator